VDFPVGCGFYRIKFQLRRDKWLGSIIFGDFLDLVFCQLSTTAHMPVDSRLVSPRRYSEDTQGRARSRKISSASECAYADMPAIVGTSDHSGLVSNIYPTR
jgi:hypothetical protein